MILEIESKYPGVWAVTWFGVIVGAVGLILILVGGIRYYLLAKEYPKEVTYESKIEGLPDFVETRESWVERELEYRFEFVGWGIVALFVAFMVLIISIPCNIGADNSYNEFYTNEYQEVVYDHIYSMDLNNEVNGRFRLGRGYINTGNYYYFYIKTGEDTYGLRKLKIEGDNVFIKETDNYGSVIQRKDKDSKFIYYVINVPYGTVVEEYSIT